MWLSKYILYLAPWFSLGNLIDLHVSILRSYSLTYGSLAPTAICSGLTGLIARHLASAWGPTWAFRLTRTLLGEVPLADSGARRSNCLETTERLHKIWNFHNKHARYVNTRVHYTNELVASGISASAGNLSTDAEWPSVPVEHIQTMVCWSLPFIHSYTKETKWWLFTTVISLRYHVDMHVHMCIKTQTLFLIIQFFWGKT